MPRVSSSSKGKARHDPLHVQLGEDEVYAKFGRVSNTGTRGKKRQDENENELDVVLDAKTSRAIFDLAKDQQEELDLVDEEGLGGESDEEREPISSRSLGPSKATRAPASDNSDEEDEDEYPEEEYEELEIDPEDMTALDALMPSNVETRKTLADMIMEKLNAADASPEGIAAKKVRISTTAEARREGPPNPAEGLNPKVVEVYT
ncbi:snoRNA-binding rRNA-processing protein, partial [Ceratobasidium sp. 370]